MHCSWQPRWLISGGAIDGYQGGQTSERVEDMMRFNLEHENVRICHDLDRVQQCGTLGKYAVADHLCRIVAEEKDHPTTLARTLGVEAPNVSRDQRAMND